MNNNKNTVTAVQIIPAPTNLYNNNKKKLIESYKQIMEIEIKCKRPRLSMKAIKLLALWDQYRLKIKPGNNGSAKSDDIDVLFLKWLLHGRCLKFYNYVLKSTSIHKDNKNRLALCNLAYNGINRVYNYNWPHNICGYMFHHIWGWLQLELKKPGENGPSTIQKQKEMIMKSYPNTKIEDMVWTYIGFGGVVGRRKDDKKWQK